jgi:hypothetical protein
MRKRLLSISIVLALVLSVAAPAAALSNGEYDAPFNCTGAISEIEPTMIDENVFPQSDGTWLVDDREIWGTFDSGDVVGPFTLTYDAVIESPWTQVGIFWGTIVAWDNENEDNCIFEVTGSLEPVETVLEGPFAGLPKVTVYGQWSLIEDDEVYGIGDFEAWAIFIPYWIDGMPHVGEIVDSSFELTGYWDNQGNGDDQGNGDGNSQ